MEGWVDGWMIRWVDGWMEGGRREGRREMDGRLWGDDECQNDTCHVTFADAI